MKRMIGNNILLLIVFLVIDLTTVYGQLTITGPTCVMPATTYDYVINNSGGDTSNIQACITGGFFISTYNTACQTINPTSKIRVTWTDTIAGKLNIATSHGNASIDVSVTSVLEGGKIDSLVVKQILDVNSIPANLYCSQAKGGNCLPAYKYQWQDSKDNIKYSDIKGEETQNLLFSKEIKRTTYYRRKVTDTISNSIAYSVISALIVPLKPNKKIK